MHLYLTTLIQRLMPRYRRKRSAISFKSAVKHSGTFVESVGQGSNVTTLTILKTGGGPRSDDGSPQTIQSFSDTKDDCKTGDHCKVVNLKIQAGARPHIGSPEFRTGWVEWAFLCVRESEKTVPSTNLGTQTLGDICTNMYRGECIYTGEFPIGDAQPAVERIMLKIPKSKTKMKLGDEWRFLTFFRAVDVTATGTANVLMIKSWNLKVSS